MSNLDRSEPARRRTSPIAPNPHVNEVLEYCCMCLGVMPPVWGRAFYQLVTGDDVQRECGTKMLP